MPKKLPIALAQVKAGNNSESLLNESSDKWSNLAHLTQTTKKFKKCFYSNHIFYIHRISNILESFYIPRTNPQNKNLKNNLFCGVT